MAQWLYQWAQDQRERLQADELFSIRAQLARACLQAGRYDQARELFQQCYEEDAARSPNREASHGPTLLGLAESHYRLAQQAAAAGQYEPARKAFSTASQQFMVIWRRAERGTPLWWQALLRALEVPVELREMVVAQLEHARRSRDLSAEERKQLGDLPAALARVEQTIRAERVTHPDLGGQGAAFSRLLNRVNQLRQRVERLTR